MTIPCRDFRGNNLTFVIDSDIQFKTNPSSLISLYYTVKAFMTRNLRVWQTLMVV